MSKLLFILTLVSFSSIVGCTPKLYTMDKDLIVKEAYTQKEIPGQQGGTIFDYLKVDFEMSSSQNVRMDSVTFRGITSLLDKNSAGLRLRLSAQHAKNKSADGSEEATLYFTKEGKAFKKVIKNISKKMPLYLP